MKKETVKIFNLEAAFKALDEIETPAVSGGRTIANRINLHERLNAKAAHEVLVEDYFDVNDVDELESAKEEREAEVAKAKLARIEKIVDLDAESEEDILPSYVGKVIMQCPQCMTLFYKDEEDIVKSEETPEMVNINEVCQHCGNDSGYTLIGKVGGINEEEAENFDLDEVSAEEGDLDLGLEDEPVEELPEEDNDELDLDLSSEEDTDLDLDLELGEEEEEETNESIHMSKLLKDAKKKRGLKSDIDSEHLTLNEDIEDIPEEPVEESMHNSEVLKDAEKKSDLKTEIESEHLSLNEAAAEEALEEDATDKLFNKLWSEPQPTPEETIATLAELGEGFSDEDKKHFPNIATVDKDGNATYVRKDGKDIKTEESMLASADDFDEASFDKCLTEYLQNVYSNVKCFESTACSFTNNKLLIEGLIKFNSGKEKVTKFVFEGKKRSSLIGTNPDFSSNAAFKLSTLVKDKTIYTESLRYSYKINESLVKGVAKK